MFERPNTSDIPTDPGAYMFWDRHGNVIYAELSIGRFVLGVV